MKTSIIQKETCPTEAGVVRGDKLKVGAPSILMPTLELLPETPGVYALIVNNGQFTGLKINKKKNGRSSHSVLMERTLVLLRLVMRMSRMWRHSHT